MVDLGSSRMSAGRFSSGLKLDSTSFCEGLVFRKRNGKTNKVFDVCWLAGESCLARQIQRTFLFRPQGSLSALGSNRFRYMWRDLGDTISAIRPGGKRQQTSQVQEGNHLREMELSAETARSVAHSLQTLLRAFPLEAQRCP